LSLILLLRARLGRATERVFRALDGGLLCVRRARAKRERQANDQ
jgi:hypothetical protein